MSEERFSGFRNNFGVLRILPAVVFSDSFLPGDGVTDADPMKRFKRRWPAACGEPSSGCYLLSFPIQQFIVRQYTPVVAGRTMPRRICCLLYR
jgi:hypothetical protein